MATTSYIFHSFSFGQPVIVVPVIRHVLMDFVFPLDSYISFLSSPIATLF